MVEWLVYLVSWALVAAGSLFFLVGAIGLQRMPDIFSRLHANSVSETAGIGLLIGGMMLQGGLTLITAKLFIILLILFFTAPIATHALAQAALAAGYRPRLAEDRTEPGEAAMPRPAPEEGAADQGPAMTSAGTAADPGNVRE
ncbi:MAG TPA: monovalent cation/H(+) antiporter subunit G [Afifellaceae bacterium]|nr:monovalent cation/H(+) antiporter subunit G [Afifellaceae bacterium]